MTDQQPVESKSLTTDELQTLIIKAFTAQDEMIEQRFSLLEKALEDSEKLVAIMVQSYSELASVTESLASVIMNKSEEDKKEFFDTLALSRKKMIDTLNHGIQIAEQNADRFTAHAPADDGQSSGN